MLELAILGLLLESPMHGYELRKRLTGLFGAFRAFSYGSLYPALRRMQVDGLIVEDAAPEGTPKMRRARRVYQLSDTGRHGSPNWWPTPGRRTTPTTVSACTWRSSTARPRGQDAHPGRPPPSGGGTPRRSAGSDRAGEHVVDRYTRQLHQLGLESSEREVKWLNELIAAERVAQGQAEQT